MTIDDKGAGGADDKNKAGGDGGAGGADDKGAAGANDDKGAVGGGYKPEGIAEHFLGKDDKETIDKLNTAVVNFRKDLSKKGVPETVDGYTLELPDEIKTKVLKPDADGKDPLLEKMKPILHKHHIPAAAFQELAGEFYGVVAELAGAAPADGEGAADFEFKELGGAEKAKPLIEGAEVWIKGLEQSKKISEKAAAELKLMAGYGEGLAALMEIREAMGEKPIPKDLGGRTGEKTITKNDLDARFSDPKYWTDKEFMEETIRLNKEYWDNAA